MKINQTYSDNLRAIVNETIVLGITKTAIADRANYSKGRFIRWTNDPDMNMTMDTAEDIKVACAALAAAAKVKA